MINIILKEKEYYLYSYKYWKFIYKVNKIYKISGTVECNIIKHYKGDLFNGSLTVHKSSLTKHSILLDKEIVTLLYIK